MLYGTLGGVILSWGLLLALPPGRADRLAPHRPLADDHEPADIPDQGPPYRLPPGSDVPLSVEQLTQETDAADWGHGPLAVPECWKVTKGKGSVVAVLDTGCDMDHRDLRDRVKASKNFTTSRAGASDVNGHGTHCAGVVLASENGTGMVGVAPEASLLVGKVLGDRGSGSSSRIAAGIDWAVDNGADVVSMSLGGSQPDQWTQAAVKRAKARGVIVVAAAGNSGPREGSVGYPGGYPEVVCVGALDAKLAVAGFSSRGPRVDVSAPGVQVRSCYPGDRFATMSGTSMATPYVAGCAALYVADRKARNLKPDPDEFRKLLEAHCRDLGPSGRDTAYGWGLVQPVKFLGGVPTPPPFVDRPVVRWSDLTPEAQKRLRDAGLDPDKLPEK